MKLHDSGYKRLFSDRTFFRQLIETFVEEEWVQQVDFTGAEQVNKSFVAEHYKETESDLIYKVPWKESVVYCYILLEFQSTVDPFMALRVLYYILGLYMDLRHTQPTLEKLPAVFPIVLYNGDRRWSAAESIQALIDPEPDLGTQAIHFTYFKIAENEYTLDHLLKVRNLVSTLFIAEAYYNLEQLVEEVTTLFERETDKQAASLLVNWLAQMAVHGRIEKEDFATLERVYRDSLEVKTMLQTAILKEKEIIYNSGKDEGMKLGKDEGMKLGKDEGKREINRLHVQRMITKGYTLPVIADLLGLSESDVQTYLSEAAEQ